MWYSGFFLLNLLSIHFYFFMLTLSVNNAIIYFWKLFINVIETEYNFKKYFCNIGV